MDCSPPDSSAHGILYARILEWVAVPSPADLQTQGSNLSLLHCRQILYQLSYQGRPKLDGWAETNFVMFITVKVES